MAKLSQRAEKKVALKIANMVSILKTMEIADRMDLIDEVHTLCLFLFIKLTQSHAEGSPIDTEADVLKEEGIND